MNAVTTARIAGTKKANINENSAVSITNVIVEVNSAVERYSSRVY